MREVLSLAVAHSKSTVPTEALAAPPELARLMRSIVFTSMADHRRAPRNAEIVAEREVAVLMVPSEAYVGQWLRPLTPQQLRDRLSQGAGSGSSPHATATPEP